ncbi:MAG: hypothetical protein AABW85_03910, partial [archaeon]
MADKMFVIVKINATDMEKLDELETAIKKIKNGQVKDIKREALGFGVEIIKAGIIINEKEEGALEKLKNEIDKIKLVETAEIEGMTL